MNRNNIGPRVDKVLHTVFRFHAPEFDIEDHGLVDFFPAGGYDGCSEGYFGNHAAVLDGEVEPLGSAGYGCV